MLIKGKRIKRIELSPVVKRTRLTADLALTGAKKHSKRIRRNLKKTFSKKRNQRRAVYAGSAFAIVSLFMGLAFTQVHAQNIEKKYQYELETKQKQVEEKQKLLQTVTQELQQVQTVKTTNDAELKAKAEKEAQLQAEVDRMKAELQARADEEARIAAEAEAARVAQATSPQPNRTFGRGGGGANQYEYGYCTWYVKERRPDISGTWGNANAWYSAAQADGYSTGHSPRAGAIGVSFEGSYGHVVYVESVNGDGSVNISEMNYAGWNVVSSRTTSASEFVYIYN